MRLRGAALFALALGGTIAGCSAISGLDGLMFDRAAGGGGAGSGGGAGGQGQCRAAKDCGTPPACRERLCRADHTCSEIVSDDGAPCGDHLHCASGVCTGCKADADCGEDTFCATQRCDTHDGSCSSTNENEGQPTPNDAPGDCVKIVCMGGAETSLPDATDVPADDGNPCTEEACVGSTPVHQPAPVDTPCGGGSDVCDGNDPPACVACTPTSGTCSNGQVCFMGACCTPLGESAACAGKCKGNVADGCGGTISCDLAACGQGSWECDASRMCCATPSLKAACGTKCSGVKSDSCNVLRTCTTSVCDAGQVCYAATCCTPKTKQQACGTTCNGALRSDGCGGLITCDATVCTGGLVCTAGMCM